MEPIAADEMVIEYVGQNIRQVKAKKCANYTVFALNFFRILRCSYSESDCNDYVIVSFIYFLLKYRD